MSSFSFRRWIAQDFPPQIEIEVSEGYFSQSGQDVFLDRFFRSNRGFFIEVGAHDGVTFSNSLHFENKGWTGLCVEASPRLFEKLARNRSCTVINSAVGSQEGRVEFADVLGYPEMLSGVMQNYPKQHLRRLRRELKIHGGRADVIEVKMEKLSTVLQRFDVQYADFISIDIEGGEVDAVKGIDFRTFSAKVILVENNYRSGEVRKLLTKFGYHRVLRVGADDVFFGPALIGSGAA